MGKRTRGDDGGVQEEGQRPAKRQETHNDNGMTAAERRQARSERKSKKSKPQKDKKDKTKIVTALVKSELVEDKDSLAVGDDFVPLAATDSLTKSSSKEQNQDLSTKKGKKGSQSTLQEADASSEPPAKKPKESVRFICFVGNLPYSCTTEQIKHHFRKIEPTSVRLMTDKATGKPKGFAFIEFDDYSKMKTCLKVYHHSIFDPERTAQLPESAFDEHGLAKEMPEPNGRRPTGRKINIELSAGGGGQGADRKQKITQKNEKLWEERERRKKANIKQQKAKDKKSKGMSEANSTSIGADAVHPDRLRQVHRE